MNKINSIISIVKQNLMDTLLGARFWSILILISGFFFVQLSGIFPHFMLDVKWDASSLMSNILSNSTGNYIKIAILVILCDIPKLNNCTMQMIMRTNRSVWMISQILYSIIISSIYYVLTYVILLCAGNRCINYSKPVPNKNDIFAFILFVLLSLLFSVLCLICNLILKHGAGNAICILLILIDNGVCAFMMNNNIQIYRFIMPNYISQSFSSGDIFHLIYASCYFMILSILLYAFSEETLRKQDMLFN